MQSRHLLTAATAARTPPILAAAPPVTADVAFTAATLALLLAAGFLQYSVASGDKGLFVYLTKELGSNPFYGPNFKADKPKSPKWFSMRLPELDFVEVYGQEPSRRDGSDAQRAAMFRELDDLIESEDYEAAKLLKLRIDELDVAPGPGDASRG